MRDEVWIKHDARSRMDPKMAYFLKQEGFRGYGLFWALIEILHYQTDHEIDLDVEGEGVAIQLDLTIEEFLSLVETLVVSGLFQLEGNRLYQRRLKADQGARRVAKAAFEASQASFGRLGGLISGAKRRGASAEEIQILRRLHEGSREDPEGASTIDKREEREENRREDLNTKGGSEGGSKPSPDSKGAEEAPESPGKPKRAAKPKVTAEELEYPPKWGEQARATMARWIAYRNEIKKPLTRMTLQAQITKYAEDPRTFHRLVNRAIDKPWQGLNEHIPLDDAPAQNGNRMQPKTGYKPHTAASTIEHNLEYIRRRRNGEEDPTGLFDAFVDDQKEPRLEQGSGGGVVLSLVGGD